MRGLLLDEGINATIYKAASSRYNKRSVDWREFSIVEARATQEYLRIIQPQYTMAAARIGDQLWNSWYWLGVAPVKLPQNDEISRTIREGFGKQAEDGFRKARDELEKAIEAGLPKHPTDLCPEERSSCTSGTSSEWELDVSHHTKA